MAVRVLEEEAMEVTGAQQAVVTSMQRAGTDAGQVVGAINGVMIALYAIRSNRPNLEALPDDERHRPTRENWKKIIALSSQLDALAERMMRWLTTFLVRFPAAMENAEPQMEQTSSLLRSVVTAFDCDLTSAEERRRFQEEVGKIKTEKEHILRELNLLISSGKEIAAACQSEASAAADLDGKCSAAEELAALLDPERRSETLTALLGPGAVNVFLQYKQLEDVMGQIDKVLEEMDSCQMEHYRDFEPQLVQAQSAVAEAEIREAALLVKETELVRQRTELEHQLADLRARTEAEREANRRTFESEREKVFRQQEASTAAYHQRVAAVRAEQARLRSQHEESVRAFVEELKKLQC